MVYAIAALQQAASYANMAGGNTGVRLETNPFFSYINCDGYRLAGGLGYSENKVLIPLGMDWTDWDGVESVVDFLNRSDSVSTWYPYDGTHPLWGYAYRAAMTYDLEYKGTFRCDVPDWLLPYVSGLDARRSKRALIIPPVWPGADRVTWGSTVPLATGVSLVEAMDGVSILLTSVPPGLGYYAFDVNRSYVKAGMVTFQNDNGDFEWPQGFSFVTHILCPKSMYQATGCVARTYPGVEGQLTAWTITP